MCLALSVLAYAELFAFLSMHNVLLYPHSLVQMDLPAWESLPPPPTSSSSIQTPICLSRPRSGIKRTNSWPFLSP